MFRLCIRNQATSLVLLVLSGLVSYKEKMHKNKGLRYAFIALHIRRQKKSRNKQKHSVNPQTKRNTS